MTTRSIFCLLLLIPSRAGAIMDGTPVPEPAGFVSIVSASMTCTGILVRDDVILPD
jgi:hypothetical protein